jgi:arabinofuranosyltransferase
VISALLISPAHDISAALRQQHRRTTRAILIAAFTYVFLANAWLGDDAYITFRVIWNVLHGYGLVFNPGERVQAYTHPLWMLVMTAAHAITREFFFTALAVSYGFALAALVVVVRSARELTSGVVAFLWLVSSKAFIDYTSSGLEYPLSYLLVVLFYVRLLEVSATPLMDRDLRRFGVVAGLCFVNRMDTVLLFAPALAWLTIRAARSRNERVLPLIVGFGTPAAAWLIFATVYYGFPLPNTYYAKVATGIPGVLLYRQGVAYLLNSFAHDPITLGTIGLTVALSIRAGLPVVLAAVGSLLYVAYTISVGGDFMSGRFFAMPFLVSVLAILHLVRSMTPAHHAAGAAALVLYNVLMPLAPIKTTASYDAAWAWRSQNGLKDERGHYHRITNPLFYSPFRELPDHTWMREGLSFRNGPEKVTVQGSIGYFGLSAGPEKHLVDRNALSDPLLARLPVSPRLYFEFYMGHFFRDIPDGYLESIASGANQLTDPVLREYYDQLRLAIRGPLFSLERIRSLWYLNAGRGRQIASRYETGRPVALSIRAANERFLVDAGERDSTAGEIRSVGRAGYLQYGPGIPMKAGAYRARWVGILTAGPATPSSGTPNPGTPDPASSRSVGFVDVWVGDQRLARRDIIASEVQPNRRELAAIDFVLPKATTHLEYRLWTDGQTPMTLERVELVSAGGTPKFQ